MSSFYLFSLFSRNVPWPTQSLVAEDSLKFQFSTDGEGNYGYLGADGSFIPFSDGLKTETFTGLSSNDKEQTFTLQDSPTSVLILTTNWRETYTTTPYDIYFKGIICTTYNEDKLTNVSNKTFTFKNNHANSVTVWYL